ncbi:DMT family transporter [Mesorhizobium sp. MSK_1335]|uniref:DMT family transporter n=1 Tax=Mesorhizobium montanum TaxID=3072323 RepID=A0ABU4ZV34_9HYPH|nr:DMT family transporter [Mesorhizobium sp. MSK_1335]MDX8529275.1 DMT family transporter [Mesorhizobium sp. MSK_1335]
MQDGGKAKANNWTTNAKLATGMALFGSATPISKIVASAMPVFVASTLRVAIGALVLFPFIARDWHDIGKLSRRDWLLVTAIALFGMFGFSVLMLYGMGMVPGTVGATVMSTTPAVTSTASIALLKDKPTWRKIAAVTLAVGGVLILQLGQIGEGDTAGNSLLLGSTLVFGAVCCETIYTLVGKKASETIDPVLVAFLAAAIAVPVFIPFAIWQWQDFQLRHVTAADWLALVWYGAGTLALGSWFWYSGVSRAEGAVAAGFMGVMPASALILSYLLLDEPFRPIHLIGFAFVFLSVLLIAWENAKTGG